MEPKISVSCNNYTVSITLAGYLDATNSNVLQDKLKELIGKPISNIVFYVKDLEYISSAGLRVIIFAKQKIGGHAKVYLIGAQEMVLNVIEMTGSDKFMIIQDSFEE